MFNMLYGMRFILTCVYKLYILLFYIHLVFLEIYCKLYLIASLQCTLI